MLSVVIEFGFFFLVFNKYLPLFAKLKLAFSTAFIENSASPVTDLPTHIRFEKMEI
jgi:hypothetical protein